MNNTKKTHPAATMSYEYALAPIAENLYQRRIFEGWSTKFSEGVSERLSKDLQDVADVYWLKAEVLADFTARLFGLEMDEVIGDASDRANATYEERRKK